MTVRMYPPVHPGEVLMEDFIKGFGITQRKLAVMINVPPRRINEIVHGKRAITADTALRLGRYFGVDPSSGSAFKPGTSWSWPATAPATRSRGSRRSRSPERFAEGPVRATPVLPQPRLPQAVRAGSSRSG